MSEQKVSEVLHAARKNLNRGRTAIQRDSAIGEIERALPLAIQLETENYALWIALRSVEATLGTLDNAAAVDEKDLAEFVTAKLSSHLADHARLLAQIEAMTEPGKASGIIRALFELAEQECGHRPIMAQHPLTSLKGWISVTKKENARLTAQVAELQAVINASESTNAVNQLVMALNKRVNDLIAEREELQKQDARWQPISTAPKDGSIFLCCFKGEFTWVVFTSRLFHGQTRLDYAQATHWIPLPAPPKETK